MGINYLSLKNFVISTVERLEELKHSEMRVLEPSYQEGVKRGSN